MKYIPLYIKTSYHLLSSMCDIKKLIEKCKELDIKSIAITDPNMYGIMEFYKECKNNAIKPIIGLELIIDNEVILLYAKNYLGYQNLTRLTFIKQDRELCFDDIKDHSNDLICIIKDVDKYKEYKKIFDDIFIGYSCIEERNRALETTKDVVFVNEVLCIEKEDIEYLKYLDLIKNNKKIDSIDEVVINSNCYLEYNIDKDYNNSKKISDMCDVSFSFNKELLPKYKGEIDSKKLLFELCKKGLMKRLNDKVTVNYKERLLYELNIIDSMGFNDYFLVVYDFIKYSRKNNILVGSGRGSAAGSLVSYCLGITEVDPIKYDLFFERFLNPQRVTLPDIDIDFESNSRAKIIDYVISKYGIKNVLPIITFSTLGGRQVIRDVGRIFDVEIRHLDILSKLIGINTELKETLSNDKIMEYIKRNNLDKLYKICLKLEGLKRQISVHASGVIISSLELDSYVPLEKYDNNYICGYSMEHLEELGLLKIDFLGLKNLTLVDEVLKKINNKDIRYETLPLDDKKTFEIFSSATTEGIFQFESEGMKNFLRKLKPNSFNDIIAAIALFRPGPSDSINTYINRKEGTEKIDYIDESLKNILKSTYGIIIYQEQIMQIASVMAGYSFGEADILRRAMAKKKKEILVKEEEKYINCSIKRGYAKEKAKEVYDLILKFANYGFNKSHSVAYSMLSFKMAYLKCNYPEVFMSCLLTNAIGNEIKIKEYINEARQLGITILKPSINSSDYEYKIEDCNIRFSLGAIKNVGSIIAKEIINERGNKVYSDFFDFVSRTYDRGINKRVIENLIYADCFNEFGFNHRTLIENIDSAINYGELSKKLDSSLIEKPELDIKDEYDKQTLQTKEIDVFGFYLSNNIISEYKRNYENIINSNDITNYFDKNVNMVLVIESIKEITTKNNKKMFFIKASDEFGSLDITVFPDYYNEASSLNANDIIYVCGKVEKRMSRYQLIAHKIEHI